MIKCRFSLVLPHKILFAVFTYFICLREFASDGRKKANARTPVFQDKGLG